jgi:hypothetical protein
VALELRVTTPDERQAGRTSEVLVAPLLGSQGQQRFDQVAALVITR